jgi:hypothetical protein
MEMRKILVLIALLAVLALGVTAVSANGTATAYVVHGIPGVPVDVYINGKLTVPNFQPGKILGPLTGPAGSAHVALVVAGGNPANPVLAGTFTFPAGSNWTVVAHLSEAGAPTVSVFENDFSPLNGQSRLIARHTAAAPAVDAVLLDGSGSIIARVGPVSNGQQGVVPFAPGTYTGALVPTGTDTIVFGPLSQNLRPNTVYVSYAIGSLAGGTFQVITQVVNVGR